MTDIAEPHERALGATPAASSTVSPEIAAFPGLSGEDRTVRLRFSTLGYEPVYKPERGLQHL
jgi:hypothetical protein